MKRLLMKFKLRDESGAVMAIVAVAMVAILGFTAIAIDGGRLYVEKSKLQKALDAAVLAGAHGLLVSEAHAITIAKDVSSENGFELDETEEEVKAVTKSFIEAEKTVQVPMFFAKVLNIDSAPVTASAKAIIGPLKSASGIAPIAIDKDDVPEETDLICTKERLTNEDGTAKTNPGGGSGQHSPGNCGFIRLDGAGAANLADAIRNGGEFSTDVNYVTTEPGGMWGQVEAAVNDLIQEDIDAGRTYCGNFATADNSCSRVIYVVLIDEWDANGTDEVDVVGFAAYWIEKFNKTGQPKYLQGKFIRAVSQGEIDEITEGETWDEDNYLYGVKLSR